METNLKTYGVYEVWTKSKTVMAVNMEKALSDNEPTPLGPGLKLCNWHAVEVKS